MNSVWLIARREITTRSRTRAFLISNAIMLIVLVAGLIIVSIFVGRSSTSTDKVGLVGTASSYGAVISASATATGHHVQTQQVPDEQTARTLVTDGKLNAALTPDRQVIVKNELSDSLRQVLASAVSQQALSNNLKSHRLTLQQVAPRADQVSLTVTETKPKDDKYWQRFVLALAGSVLLFIGVTQFAAAVGVGVVEEKATRVVEILLAAVKPLHLLWGKILGVGLLGLAQVTVMAAAGLITASATGLLTLPWTAGGMLAATLVWFVLGYTFFSTLYAAGGSMVSRQEEINSTTTPILVLLMATGYLAFFGTNSLDSTFYKTMSWIPPFSSTLMPMQIAAGNVSILEVVGSALIMAAACAIAAWIAARIYAHSVLRVGARVSWGEALRLRR